MKRSVGWGLVALQFVLLIALVVVPRRPTQPIWIIVGGLVLIAGVILGWYAFRALGNALTPTPVPLTHAGLRTDGIYAYLRHPIYSAVLLMVLGYVIAWGSWWSVLVAGMLLVFFIGKLRWEDQLLEKAYGPDWNLWAQQTNALVPRFGSTGK